MGGHDCARNDDTYRQIAHMARQLASDGYLVVSGGRPRTDGSPQTWALTSRHGKILAPSIPPLSKCSSPRSTITPNGSARQWKTKAAFPTPDPDKSRSLGIPTWFYGHEPPNIFATHIAKYFENSLREEGLLAIATHGVIFAQGNAGTTQEIFQDACQNYYATYGFRSPMVLFGDCYWGTNAR